MEYYEMAAKRRKKLKSYAFMRLLPFRGQGLLAPGYG